MNSPVQLVVHGRQREVGGHAVARVLPWIHCRAVGPFVFLDHLGPLQMSANDPFDVPPHPHIGLCTVTYLMQGEAVHRDSLGTEQLIRAGDVNWMSAGRGIVHSERSTDEARRVGSSMHGLQLWVALPRAVEESAPTFQHVEASAHPKLEFGGVGARLLAGAAFGLRSPLEVASPLFYVDAELDAGARFAMPNEHAERAIYILSGEIGIAGTKYAERQLLVLAPGEVELRSVRASRIVLIGGAPLDGPRHMWWNFVSSSRERIEQAKSDWRAGRFPRIPNDAGDPIPLPE